MMACVAVPSKAAAPHLVLLFRAEHLSRPESSLRLSHVL